MPAHGNRGQLHQPPLRCGVGPLHPDLLGQQVSGVIKQGARRLPHSSRTGCRRAHSLTAAHSHTTTDPAVTNTAAMPETKVLAASRSAAPSTYHKIANTTMTKASRPIRDHTRRHRFDTAPSFPGQLATRAWEVLGLSPPPQQRGGEASIWEGDWPGRRPVRPQHSR